MGRSGNPPLFRRCGADLGPGLPPRARALPKAATKPGGKGRRAGKAEQVGNLPKVTGAPGQVAAGNIFAGPVEQFEEPGPFAFKRAGQRAARQPELRGNLRRGLRLLAVATIPTTIAGLCLAKAGTRVVFAGNTSEVTDGIAAALAQYD